MKNIESKFIQIVEIEEEVETIKEEYFFSQYHPNGLTLEVERDPETGEIICGSVFDRGISKKLTEYLVENYDMHSRSLVAKILYEIMI